jgi:hypothetical protein
MMVSRNRLSSQNESPKEPVRGTENILTSRENTYRKACIEHKKATLQILILIPLLVGATRSLVERTGHQMAVFQILREQTELADSDRHGRGLSNPPILPIMFIPSSVPRRKSGALGSAKMVTKFEWIVVVQAAQELSSIPTAPTNHPIC